MSNRFSNFETKFIKIKPVSKQHFRFVFEKHFRGKIILFVFKDELNQRKLIKLDIELKLI